jgi:hypothetical protein
MKHRLLRTVRRWRILIDICSRFAQNVLDLGRRSASSEVGGCYTGPKCTQECNHRSLCDVFIVSFELYLLTNPKFLFPNDSGSLLATLYQRFNSNPYPLQIILLIRLILTFAVALILSFTLTNFYYNFYD